MSWLEQNKKFHQSLTKSEHYALVRNCYIGAGLMSGYFAIHVYFFSEKNSAKTFEAIVSSSSFLKRVIGPAIFDYSGSIFHAILALGCVFLAALSNLQFLKFKNIERQNCR